MLHGKDVVQIAPAGTAKTRCPPAARPAETPVEFGNVFLAQELVGRFQGVIPRNRNSCGSRPCQVPKLRSLTPARLRGIGRDHLDPSSFSARPTCVSRCGSTFPPALGVSKKWLARSL